MEAFPVNDAVIIAANITGGRMVLIFSDYSRMLFNFNDRSGLGVHLDGAGGIEKRLLGRKYLGRTTTYNLLFSGKLSIGGGDDDCLITTDRVSAVYVVGLPGSGKTHLLRERFTGSSYEVFDDYLTNYYSDESQSRLAAAMLAGRTIVFSDPRLCRISVFREQTARHPPAHIIVFVCDKNQCLDNIAGRESASRYAADIERLSASYDVTQYAAHEIIPVYKA